MALTQVQGAMIGPSGVANLTGVQFPATQVPSSDPNCLDDYEEGSWTPTVGGTSTAGTASYSVQTGRYTKIGNMVYVTCYVTWSSSTGTGAQVINGLPFVGQNQTNYQGLVVSGVSGFTNSNPGTNLFCRVGNGESRITWKWINTLSTVSDGDVSVSASGTLLASGFYQAQ